jgi:large subunit ribosomal protein L15
MLLHELKPAPGSRKQRLIVGRGEGSTMGQTAGKGQKGQRARSGERFRYGFEGGQTPLMRRIPKRGFRHPSKIHYQAINIQDLEATLNAGPINADVLYKSGFLKDVKAPYKILGQGKCTKAFQIKAPKFSKSAEKVVKKAGGSLAST